MIINGGTVRFPVREVDALELLIRNNRFGLRFVFIHGTFSRIAGEDLHAGWFTGAEKWPQPAQSSEFTRFVAWARARLNYLEHAVDAEGIAETLKSQALFPESDPLIDPPEDLIEEL